MAPPCVVSSVYYRDARSTCAGNMTTSTVRGQACFLFSRRQRFHVRVQVPGEGSGSNTRTFRGGFWARRRGKSSAVSSPLEAALAFTAVWARSTDLCFSALQDPTVKSRFFSCSKFREMNRISCPPPSFVRAPLERGGLSLTSRNQNVGILFAEVRTSEMYVVGSTKTKL